MNRNHISTRILLSGAALAVATITGAQSRTCPEFRSLAEAAVPTEVGTTDLIGRMLAVPEPAVALGDVFNPHRAQMVVGERGLHESKDGCCTDEKCVYTDDKGATMRFSLDRGKVSYMSRPRSADRGDNTVTGKQATELALRAAVGMGLPPGEIELSSVRTQEVADFAQGLDDAGREVGDPFSRRAEVFVRFQRSLGGFRVFGSRGHAAIDARGQVARMHLKWAAFRQVPGLEASNAVPRGAVVQRIVDELEAYANCGTIAAVKGTVAFVPESRVDGFGRGDDDEVAPPTTGPAPAHHSEPEAFVPALVVSLMPTEQAEDSGVPQMPGQMIFLPLVSAGPSSPR